MSNKKNNSSLLIVETPTTHNYVEDSLVQLKEDGARVTKTRKAVLSCLAKTEKPLTPAEIMNMINKDTTVKTKIDLVSVYRILKYLDDLSLVHQVGSEGAYFPCIHKNCKDQTHLIINCSECRSTNEVHLPEDLSTSLFQFLDEKVKFLADPHSLEIKGICRACYHKNN